MTPDIRRLTAADFAAWEPLWQGYLVFYRTSVPAATTELTFARLTSGEEPMGGFLAWEGGRAIGMVNWITHRSCWTPGTIATCRTCSQRPRRAARASGGR